MGCAVEGCTRPIHGKGLCHGHHSTAQQRALLAHRAVYGPWCSVAGCTQPVISMGLCRNHKSKHRRQFGTTPCRTNGCTLPVVSKGLCLSCYRKTRRGTLAVCVNGCTPKKLYSQGMCQACYKRGWRRAQKEAA
jgi:hypothetical protein